MRVYFCSDLHASRKCWKKFLASARFYEADVIVVGGDITGKFVVPIVEGAGGARTATFMGVERRVGTPDELETLKTRIADAGQYPFETTPDERDWYAEDTARVDALFKRLALDRVADWVAEAEDKLGGTGTRVLVSGANDDFLEVDDVLATSAVIEDPNGTVVDLDDGYQILGMGWGNQTPGRARGTSRRTSSPTASTRSRGGRATPPARSSACTCRPSAAASTPRRSSTPTCARGWTAAA